MSARRNRISQEAWRKRGISGRCFPISWRISSYSRFFLSFANIPTVTSTQEEEEEAKKKKKKIEVRHMGRKDRRLTYHEMSVKGTYVERRGCIGYMYTFWKRDNAAQSRRGR